jgi:hypothetical protein
MVSKKKNIPEGQSSLEPLTGKGKLLVFALCLFNPLILGAIFYYGWKKKLPQHAKTANLLSFAAAAIFLVLYLGNIYLVVKKVGTENITKIATDIKQVQSLDEQAKAIVATPDAEDAADIQAINGKIVLGYDKASQWQSDAKWYSYRRVFSLPDNTPEADKILNQADSYYYESKKTNDVYEILFDKNSNNILRIDTDPSSSLKPNYVNNFTDIFTVKVGPKKALEIAMLSPDFQNYKQTHSQILTHVILNPTDNVPESPSLPKYWFVGMTSGFSDTGGVQALVNSQTGELISEEAINTINQIENASQKQ